MSVAAASEATRAGFVAIIGRPNVGKSTLLNALIGEHVSITSRRPQTTRNRVLGVLTRVDHVPPQQFVFVDTPGFQRQHRTLLTRRMNDSVRGTLGEVDAVVLVIESRGWTAQDAELLALLARAGERAPKVVLAINKSDLLTDRDRLLPLMADSAQRYPFAAIVPVSAEKGRQLDALLAELGKLLPVGEFLYDVEQYTDRSVRFLAAEQVREKAFRLLGDELPYGIAVTVDAWEEDDHAARILMTLLVDRDSHKGIVIGAGGAKLREIGRLARIDIEQMLGKPVFLETHVRVRSGWSDDAAALRQLGYD